jgi:hypothetical protein
MPSEYLGELKKWASEMARSKDGGEVHFNRAVDLVAKTFGVQVHEVAILGLTPDGRSLKFIAPDNLRIIGQIPLSSTNSLAARTARERRGEVINHFSVVPHASVFEAVPIAEAQRGDAIQKIMSSPVISAGKAIGVVQISRKGKSTAEAGPDFTHTHLRELKIVCDALAPCLLLCGRE